MTNRVSYTHNPMVAGDLVASEEAIWIDPVGGLILRLELGSTNIRADRRAFIYLGDDNGGCPWLYFEGGLFTYIDMGNERPFNVLFRRISGDPEQA